MLENVPSDMCTHKDSDQPAHSQHTIRIFTGCILDRQKEGVKFLHVDNEDFDQTTQMHRLIVYIGCMSAGRFFSRCSSY